MKISYMRLYEFSEIEAIAGKSYFVESEIV